MKSKYKLPRGVQDYLPKECSAKVTIERRVLDSLSARGYERIATPVIERYELFAGGDNGVAPDKLFKMSDLDGNLLVLRPDMTMPASRVINTKLPHSEIYKLCYLGNAFALNAEDTRYREFTQAGAEIVAPSSPIIDAEAIALAINVLIESGLKDFQIDIGHVGYFKGLLKRLKLSGAQEKEFTALIGKKDMLGVELFARGLGVAEDGLQPILSLASAFGGTEVLYKARALSPNEECTAAISDLIRVTEILGEFGLSDYISIDLSLVNGYGYYTGIVFKGISGYIGDYILSGGRYDTLSSAFDKNNPGIGFAVGIENLMTAISRGEGLPRCGERKIAVGYAENYYKEGYAETEKMKAAGIRTDNVFVTTPDKLRVYARSTGAKGMVFIGGETIREDYE